MVGRSLLVSGFEHSKFSGASVGLVLLPRVFVGRQEEATLCACQLDASHLLVSACPFENGGI